MKKSIIIAHYHEDLRWLLDSDISDKVTVYSKGNQDLDYLKHLKNIAIFSLDNIGHEQHTYFYHIVKNYDELEDITFFVQGDPFEHSANFIQKYKSSQTGGISDFNMVTSYLPKTPEGKYHPYINHFYSSGVSVTDIEGKTFIDPWNNEDTRNNINHIKEILPEVKIEDTNWMYNANGMYSLSKEMIYRHPKSFYQRCLNSFYVNDPKLNMIAHAYERISALIFNI